MPSAVDIANLALGYLGDTATVTSIDPPEGSAQSQHCARFYPVALKSLIEMASWSFCTRRVYLAKVENPWSMWRFAYACPSDAVNVLSVLPKCALDDYSQTALPPDFYPWPEGYFPPYNSSIYVPQPYSMETDAERRLIILTNVEDAVCRYTSLETEPGRFSALFVEALAWKLASMLAGPLLKGDVGAAESKRCLQLFALIEAQAESSDANQRNIKPTQAVPWIVGR